MLKTTFGEFFRCMAYLGFNCSKIVFAFFDSFANIACVRIRTIVLLIKIFNLQNYLAKNVSFFEYYVFIWALKLGDMGRSVHTKELSFSHKLKFSNSYIFTT